MHSLLRVSQPPQTLDELSAVMALWDRLNDELPKIEQKFPPLSEQFAVLEKYEVPLSPEVDLRLSKLNDEWSIFKQTLVDSEQMIKKHKEKFKSSLLSQSDEFKKQVNNLLVDFQSNGPFSSSIPTGEALSSIATTRAQLDALKDQEQTLRKGLNLFKIEHPPSKEIAALEKVRTNFWGHDLNIRRALCLDS